MHMPFNANYTQVVSSCQNEHVCKYTGKKGHSDTVLGEANILNSTELAKAILYNGYISYFERGNSFRHIGSLMNVDWFHPITATSKSLNFILSSKLVGISKELFKFKSVCILLYFYIYIYIVFS